MGLGLAILIVAVAVTVGVTAMLLVRRHAPEEGFFTDGDRAAGVFGVLATGFSVLLGFVVFLAFASYDQSRQGAETEALVVAQQLETAQLLPESARTELTGELICYARSVAGPQWDRMEAGTLGDQINPWGADLFSTLQTLSPDGPTEEAAYGKWLDQTSDREAARNDRVHGAVGVIPVPLWIVLFFAATVIFVFMLFFADPSEMAIVQAVLMGSVVAVVSASLLLLQFLDAPFHEGIGGLEPVAMERTIRVIDQELDAVGFDRGSIPCDERGIPS